MSGWVGRIGSILGVAALCAGTAPALASSATVTFTGRVPTICRVALSDAPPVILQAGDNRLGSTDELCNSVDGYRIVLNHPSGLVDAWVIIDGARIAINSGATSTVIVDSSQPGDGRRELGLHLARPVEGPLPLSLAAEVKGAIF